jgi:hypothetical protein
VLQHRREVVVPRPIHQAMPLQFGDRADAGAIGHEDDGGGMLENHSDDDRVGPLCIVQQNAGRADAEVGVAGRQSGVGIDRWTAFANFDLKALLAVVPLSLFDPDQERLLVATLGEPRPQAEAIAYPQPRRRWRLVSARRRRKSWLLCLGDGRDF